MRSFLLFTSLVISTISSYGQSGISAKLKDLAVPNSPAFIILDLTPSVIQTPNTPKEFILGVAQSYQDGSDGFPKNYAAEFTPYWWINPSGRNVYSAVGLRTTKDKEGRITEVGKQDPFAGLKFATISFAFAGKDMIPDTQKLNQKIISIGVKATILKLNRKNYANTLANEVREWHAAAQEEFDNNREVQDKLARYNGDDEEAFQQKLLDNFKTERTGGIVKRITEVLAQKPLFSWDIGAAHAIYGIKDSIWRSVRWGIWTTMSTYLLLTPGREKNSKNYLTLNLVFRYRSDNYQADKQKKIVRGNSLDAGGKFAMEFEKLSVGIEALYRFKNKIADPQNRTVGVLNYKIADNLYLRAAFGKDFKSQNKLIALFGINLGIGTETIKLPE